MSGVPGAGGVRRPGGLRDFAECVRAFQVGFVILPNALYDLWRLR